MEGSVFKDENSGNDLTLGMVCVQALLSNDKDENIDGVEKMRRYELAKQIYSGNIDEIKAEEVVLLKKLVGKFFAIVIAGQVLPMLDGS